MVPGPSSESLPEALTPCRDRLAGNPSLDILGQLPGRCVSRLGLRGHRLQTDHLEGPGDPRIDACGSRETAFPDAMQDFRDRASLERRSPGEQGIECGAEAKDVARRAEFIPS